MVGRPKRLTATGDVPGAVQGGTCGGFCFSPGTAISTLTIREGGAAGAILFQLVAAANSSPIPADLQFRYEGQLHVTLAGAAAEVTILT